MRFFANLSHFKLEVPYGGYLILSQIKLLYRRINWKMTLIICSSLHRYNLAHDDVAGVLVFIGAGGEGHDVVIAGDLNIGIEV